MVPFKGQISIKQYIKSKPKPWGINVFVFFGSSGIVYDFMIYQGKQTSIPIEMKEKFGIGSSTVLQLTNIFPKKCNFNLYFDNYFTALPLLLKLKESRIFSVGTIRKNRDGKCPLLSDKDLKQGGHGSMDEMRDKK